MTNTTDPLVAVSEADFPSQEEWDRHTEADRLKWAAAHYARHRAARFEASISHHATPGAILDKCIAELGEAEPFVCQPKGSDGYSVLQMSAWKLVNEPGTSHHAGMREALAPFADAGEFLDLETDGFLGGEKLSLFHEDHELFDGLKFGDFVRAAKVFASLQPPQDEKGWQPIETAPKDRVIDVWVNGEFPGRRTDVEWREPTDSEWWVHGGDTIQTPDATWHDCFGPLGKLEAPTHWRDPPAPPAALTSQGGEHGK